MDLSNIDVVVVDFETVELQPDGSTTASTEFYRSNFRVSACAFSWFEGDEIKSLYTANEENTGKVLKRLSDFNTKLIAHNIQFDMAVAICRFPKLKLNWYADTMRLVQNWDNGGGDDDFEIVIDTDIVDQEENEEQTKSWKPLQGFGLVKSLKRAFRDDYKDHKEEAYKWIRENVPEARGKKEGEFLDKLSEDLLYRYTVGDTEWTLRLYKFIVDDFEAQGFDWTFDHMLFLNSVRLIVDAKIRGIKINRTNLTKLLTSLNADMESIYKEFRTKFEKHIREIEAERLKKFALDCKTPEARRKRFLKALHNKEKWQEVAAFNVGSNKQLERLFIEKMKIEPKFFTEKNSPSFKSSVLHQFGEGGEILKNRRKVMLVQKQAEALLALSEFDERWHQDLRAVGTATSRYSGGSHG